MNIQSISERTLVPVVAVIASLGIAIPATWWWRDREAEKDMAIAHEIAIVDAKVSAVLNKLDALDDRILVALGEVRELKTVMLPRAEADARWQLFSALNSSITVPGVK